MSKNTIPDGWIPFSAVGKPIPGTRFIAFKVPLKELLCNKVAPEQRFSPAMLMEMEPKLSLVIDLTNTTRYYDKQEFTTNGIKYAKIGVPGRILPDASILQRFFDVVDGFTKSSKKEDELIGVHCTHGVNRTGYFICKYMIKKLGFEPENAITIFQEARGHEIERQNYIGCLYGKSTIEGYPGLSQDETKSRSRTSRSHNTKSRSRRSRSPRSRSPRSRSPRSRSPRSRSPRSRSSKTGDTNMWRANRPQRQEHGSNYNRNQNGSSNYSGPRNFDRGGYQRHQTYPNAPPHDSNPNFLSNTYQFRSQLDYYDEPSNAGYQSRYRGRGNSERSRHQSRGFDNHRGQQNRSANTWGDASNIVKRPGDENPTSSHSSSRRERTEPTKTRGVRRSRFSD